MPGFGPGRAVTGPSRQFEPGRRPRELVVSGCQTRPCLVNDSIGTTPFGAGGACRRHRTGSREQHGPGVACRAGAGGPGHSSRHVVSTGQTGALPARYQAGSACLKSPPMSTPAIGSWSPGGSLVWKPVVRSLSITRRLNDSRDRPAGPVPSRARSHSSPSATAVTSTPRNRPREPSSGPRGRLVGAGSAQ